MILRNIFFGVLILAAVLGSRLLLTRDNAPVATTSTPAAPGYYLRDAVIEGMGTDGRRLYTLRASNIVQTPGTDSVAIMDVNLEYALSDAQPWHLSADSGEIPADGQHIALRGNVTMEEQLMRGEAMTIITTPALDIDLNAHLASTDADVIIERGNYRLSAKGMSADLKGQNLTLQSDVHGRFLP